MIQYIYLVHVREFLSANVPIYKIGMSTKENYMRFSQYPKGSHLLFQMKCVDCKTLEQQLIALFSHKFICRRDIGAEYFEGNCDEMIDYIYNAIQAERSLTIECNDTIPMTVETPNKFAAVIITDKKKLTGYCREHNKTWTQLSSGDIDDNIRRNIDTLFCKKPEFYNLAYNEFLVRTSDLQIDYLFDAQKLTFTPIDDTEIATRIAIIDPLKQTVPYNDLTHLNTTTVEHICKYFMTGTIKKLITAIFVCPKKSFTYNDVADWLFNRHIVANVVVNILDVLAPNKWINASLFYSNPEEFKRLVKIYKPRVCIIEEISSCMTENGVNYFNVTRQLEKYGFTVFIVKSNHCDSSAREFIAYRNRQMYKGAINCAAIELNKSPEDELFEDIVKLLSSPQYYMFQFLKMCSDEHSN